MTVRIGDRLWDNYGSPRVRPAVASAGFSRSTGGFGWYLFTGAEARLVGRNIFIEGNTFRDSSYIPYMTWRLLLPLESGKLSVVDS